MAPQVRPIEERFWEKVEKPFGEEGCWMWTASRFQNSGIPQFKARDTDGKWKNYIAYRMAWLLVKKEGLPKSVLLTHTCENRLDCVNPNHLLPVKSILDVVELRQARGHTAKGDGNGSRTCPESRARLNGEANPMAKLTDAQVAEIRSSRDTAKNLSKVYGVAPMTIYKLRGFTKRKPAPTGKATPVHSQYKHPSLHRAYWACVEELGKALEAKDEAHYDTVWEWCEQMWDYLAKRRDMPSAVKPHDVS